jgi:hypothetical protein
MLLLLAPPRATNVPPTRRWHSSADELRSSLLVARLVVIAWSLLRLAACRRSGLDLDGWLAILVILGTSVTFLPWTRWARRWSRPLEAGDFDAFLTGERKS